MRGIYTPEEALSLYQMLINCHEERVSLTHFCKKSNLDYKIFSNFANAVLHCQLSNPKQYEKALTLRDNFINSNLKNQDFCLKYGIKRGFLDFINRHFSIWRRIELEMIKTGIDPTLYEHNPYNRVNDRERHMNFVKVKNERSQSISSIMRSAASPPFEPMPQGEYIKAKNDLEISISYGIKVTLPHDTDTEKMLKVINFLKEL